MSNRIVLNETSYHGAGAIQEIASEAKARGFHKAFVCSDPDLIKFGVTGKVLKVLDDAGLAYEVYSDIKANPTIENVQTGVAAFQASGADYMATSTPPASTKKRNATRKSRPRMPSDVPIHPSPRSAPAGSGSETNVMRSPTRGVNRRLARKAQ